MSALPRPPRTALPVLRHLTCTRSLIFISRPAQTAGSAFLTRREFPASLFQSIRFRNRQQLSCSCLERHSFRCWFGSNSQSRLNFSREGIVATYYRCAVPGRRRIWPGQSRASAPISPLGAIESHEGRHRRCHRIARACPLAPLLRERVLVDPRAILNVPDFAMVHESVCVLKELRFMTAPAETRTLPVRLIVPRPYVKVPGIDRFPLPSSRPQRVIRLWAASAAASPAMKRGTRR